MRRDVADGDAPVLQFQRIAQGPLKLFGRDFDDVLLAVAEIGDFHRLAHRRGENQLVHQRQVFGQFDVDRPGRGSG